MRFGNRCLRRLAVCASAVLACPSGAEVFRAFHVGNSVTDTLGFNEVTQMAAAAGHTYVAGRHTLNGTPLGGIWQNSGHANNYHRTYGYWPEALANHPWDAVTLQPYDRKLTGDDTHADASRWGDVKAAGSFIQYTLDHLTPGTAPPRFYVYAGWPFQSLGTDTRQAPSGERPLVYANRWNATYDGSNWYQTFRSRDYYERLRAELIADFPQLAEQLFILPVGEVLYEIDRKINQSGFAGLTSITDLYTDAVHFNGLGRFIVGTTVYATLLGVDPTGLPADAYDIADYSPPEFALEVQETVWDVVNAYRYSGVPEPASVALLLPAGWLALRRRK